MTKIIYKTGNIFDGNETVIVHGCNAQGVMGSGIAAQIKSKFPHAFETYRRAYMFEGLKVGDIVPSPLAEPGAKLIINAITQERFGRDPNTVYVSYEGVKQCIRLINRYFIGEVAMPLIGAGLANGSWTVISQIIEEESSNFQPVVYLLDGKIPA